MKVVIIGGGASGIFCLKRLLENGVDDVLLFEAGSELGGVWSSQCKSPGGRAYKNLTTNSSRIACSVGGNVVASNSEFPNASEMQRYYESYANFKHIHLNDRVESVTKQSDDVGFFVQTSSGKRIVASHVIVCTGTFAHPNADIECVSGFSGSMIHSKNFVDFSSLQIASSGPRRILVLGIGNSALDIVCELLDGGHEVFLSSEGAMLLPLWCKERDEPGDYYILSEAFAEKNGWEKFQCLQNMSKELTEQMEGFGMPQATSGRLSIVKRPQTLIDAASSKKLHFCPKIEKCEGQTVLLKDGSQLQHVDGIILCTGYRIGLDFLDPSIRPLERMKSPSGSQSREDYCKLYKYVVHPSIPNLFFCGFFDSFGNNGVVSDMQARWITECITGKLPLPDTKTMQKWANAQLEKDAKQMGHSYMYRSYVSMMKMYAKDLKLTQMKWPKEAPLISMVFQSKL